MNGGDGGGVRLVRFYVRLCCIDERLQILGAAMGRDSQSRRACVAGAILTCRNASLLCGDFSTKGKGSAL